MHRYRIPLLSLALLATLGTDASAQAHRRRSRVHVVQPFYGAYYGPYYGSHFYDPYYRPYAYHRDPYETSAVRLKVKPSDARVFVDGGYVGTVDDFDGAFQQLDLKPGRHEISVKRAGYVTRRFRVYAAPARTLKIEEQMEKGSGQDKAEDLGGR
jgi:hypothetical protein